MPHIRLSAEGLTRSIAKFREAIVGTSLLGCLLAAAVACQGDAEVAPPTATPGVPTASIEASSTSSITPATPAPTVLVPDSFFTPCEMNQFPVARQRHFLDWSPDGSLLFDFDEKIWIIRGDGSLVELVDPEPLDDRSRHGVHADFSPAGDKVVYSTCHYPTKDGASFKDLKPRPAYEIATINIDGTDQQRRTVNNILDHFPSWSPDGETIVYVRSFSQTPDYNVSGAGVSFLSKEDGWKSVRPMTSVSRVALYAPLWSPDSQRLVVAVSPPGTQWEDPRSWWTMKPDGSERKEVGKSSVPPTWSPDSERLALVELDEAGDLALSIHTVRYDGTDRQEVWDGGLEGHYPPITSTAWSPDGSEILVVSRWLWAINLDSGNTRVLGPEYPPIWLVEAIWSPDGSMIAARGSEYSRHGVGPFGVIVLSADGSDLRILAAEDGNGVLREGDADDDD